MTIYGELIMKHKSLWLIGIAALFAIGGAVTATKASTWLAEADVMNKVFTFSSANHLPTSAITSDSNSYYFHQYPQTVDAAAGTFIIVDGSAPKDQYQTTEFANSTCYLKGAKLAANSYGASLSVKFYIKGLTSIDYVTTGTSNTEGGSTPAFTLSIMNDTTANGSVSNPGTGTLNASSGYGSSAWVYINNYAAFQITTLTFHYHC
jgi:hypothetical protein